MIFNMGSNSNLYVKSLEIGSFVGVLPWKWNSYNRSFERTSSRVKKARCSINVLVMFVYIMTLSGRYVHVRYFREEKASAGDMADFQALLVVAILCFIYLVNISQNYNFHLRHANNLIWLGEKNQQDEKEGQRSPHGRTPSRPLRPVTIFVILVALIYILRLTAKPGKIYHLTGFLHQKSQRSLLGLALRIFTVYCWSIQFFAMHWANLIMFHHGEVMSAYLRNMDPTEGISSKNFQSKAKDYNVARVLQRDLNELWGNIYTVAISVCLLAITMNVYQAVLAFKLKSLILGVGTWYILRSIVNATAEFYALSEEMLLKWRPNNPENRWFRKYLQSIQPTRTRMGSFGYIDKQMNLTHLGIIVDNAVTLIVANRNT